MLWTLVIAFGVLFSTQAVAQEASTYIAGQSPTQDQVTPRDLDVESLLLENESGVSASVGKVISLHLEDASLDEALQRISEKADLNLLYSSEKVAGENVTLKTEKTSVHEALGTILQGTGLSIEVFGDHLVLVDDTQSRQERESEKVAESQVEAQGTSGSSTALSGVRVSQANLTFQTGTVAGTVTDGTSGEPMQGVNILVMGTQQGSITDEDGSFRITGVEAGTHTVRATFIGYAEETQEVQVEDGETTTVDFALQPSEVALDNVVVTALGVEREQRSLSYSTQEVEGQDLTQAPELNVAASLQGRVSGLSVSQAGQGVGSPTRLLIRGNRSITGSSQPLIVVDGVPIREDLSNISSYNIESVEVLKGPNAAALYGSEAQNGVILIETKGADEGQVGFSFSQNVMARAPMIPYDFQNQYGQGSGGQYDRSTEGSWGARMEGQSVQHWSPAPDLRDQTYSYSPQSGNVRDVYQVGYNSSTNFSATVGAEDVQSFFSYTYTDASGVTPQNQLARHNVQVKTNAQPTESLSLNGKLTYSREVIDNNLPTGNSQGNATKLALLLPRSVHTQHAENFSYRDTDGVQRQNYWNPGTIGGGNPYWAIHRNLSENTTNRIIGLASVTYDFTDFLNLQVRGSVDNSNTESEQRLYNDTFTSAPRGEFDVGKNSSVRWNTDVLLNYEQNVTGNVNIDANVGGSIRHERSSSIGANTGNGLTLPNFFSISNTRNVQAGYDVGNRREVQSLYGSGTVSWNDAVFLELTGRNDWSSTLPADSRSFFYPSVGLSTVLTDLVPDVFPDFVDFAKVRGSWSRVGNSAPPFMLQRTANFNSGGRNGFITISSTLPADNLKPEQTDSWEIGTNIRTFGERVGLDLNYYHTTTSNQLFTVNVPVGTGAGQKFTNGGSVRNKGWEATLSLTPIQTQDFDWTMDLNWSKNMSLVEKISERRPRLTIGGSFMHELVVEEGEPFGEIYTVGFERDDQGRVIVGQNGVPLSTSGPTVNVGNFNPDWEGGISSTFSYQGLSLRVLIDHRQGGDMATFTSSRLDAAGVTKRTLEGREEGVVFGEDVFSEETAVRQDGSPNNTSVSSEQLWTNIGGRETSIGEAFIEDATNMQLREVTLSYTLPQSVVSRIPVSNVNFSLVGRNLLFLYRASDRINPNFLTGTGSGAQGFNSFAPPTPRTFGFNLSIDY
jgi:TonB-linked SusC/RagA family outer membrane protein